jgi:hypothetical protein
VVGRAVLCAPIPVIPKQGCAQAKCRAHLSRLATVDIESEGAWPTGIDAPEPSIQARKEASDRKAVEGNRTPSRYRDARERASIRQVVERGCPLPPWARIHFARSISIFVVTMPIADLAVPPGSHSRLPFPRALTGALTSTNVLPHGTKHSLHYERLTKTHSRRLPHVDS